MTTTYSTDAWATTPVGTTYQVWTEWYSYNDGCQKSAHHADLRGGPSAQGFTDKLAATDLAGRYVLALVAKDGGRVDPVGRDGWRVTLADGYTETVTVREYPPVS